MKKSRQIGYVIDGFMFEIINFVILLREYTGKTEITQRKQEILFLK